MMASDYTKVWTHDWGFGIGGMSIRGLRNRPTFVAKPWQRMVLLLDKVLPGDRVRFWSNVHFVFRLAFAGWLNRQGVLYSRNVPGGRVNFYHCLPAANGSCLGIQRHS
jgi:hypothetical protein